MKGCTESVTRDIQPMKRKAFLCLLLFFGIGYPLLSLLNCLYVSVESDILTAGGAVAQILFLIYSLTSAFFFFVTFGVLIVSLCRRRAGDNLPILVLAFGSLVYKYAVNLLITYLLDGFPRKPITFGNDLLGAFFNLLPELIEVLLVFLFARANGERYRSRVSVSASALKYLQEDRTLGDRFRLYPYRKIYDRTNPLLAGAMSASIINLIMRLFSFVLGELSLSVGGGWIPSTLGDWLSIAAELAFEILLSAGGFFFVRWFAGHLYERTNANSD